MTGRLADYMRVCLDPNSAIFQSEDIARQYAIADVATFFARTSQGNIRRAKVRRIVAALGRRGGRVIHAERSTLR